MDGTFEERLEEALGESEAFLVYSEGQRYRLGVDIRSTGASQECEIELLLKIELQGAGRPSVLSIELDELTSMGFLEHEEVSAWLSFYRPVEHVDVLRVLRNLERWIGSRSID